MIINPKMSEENMIPCGYASSCPFAKLSDERKYYIPVRPPLYRDSQTQVDMRSTRKAPYEPLEGWQIRVMSLYCGRDDSPLVAQLYTVDMLYEPGILIHGTKIRTLYQALSYCWGDPSPCRTIICNDAPFRVSEEIYKAIGRLRSFHAPLNLWTDATCINQDDEKEKSSQFAKMLLIYQKAQSVFVWLGEHGENTRLIVSLLICLNREILDWRHDNQKRAYLFQQIERCSKLCRSHSVSLLNGLKEWVRRPWFGRIWVRQEI